MKIRLNVEHVRKLKAQIAGINKTPIDDIIFIEDGKESVLSSLLHLAHIFNI